jgi:hypothetical protein
MSTPLPYINVPLTIPVSGGQFIIGQSIPVTVFITDAYGVPSSANTILWQSVNPAIAIVDNVSFQPGTNNTVSTSTIHAISGGTTTVNIIVNGAIFNYITVTVTTPSPVNAEIVIGTPSP